jgi:hypothetical protein
MRPGSEMPPACVAISNAGVNICRACSIQDCDNESVCGGGIYVVYGEWFAGGFLDLQEVAYVSQDGKWGLRPQSLFKNNI